MFFCCLECGNNFYLVDRTTEKKKLQKFAIGIDLCDVWGVFVIILG